MNVLNGGHGCLPDPLDDGRDEPHRFAHLVSELGAPLSLPPEASLQAHVLDVLAQGPINSCVPNTGFQGIRVRQSALGVVAPLGARHFGYYLSRADHGMADFDIGTHNRSFFRAVTKYGFLAESEYPLGYDWRKVNQPPPAIAYRRAFDQRVADKEPNLRYRRITEVGDERIDRVMQAIALDMPVMFGTEVSRAFVAGTGITDHVQEQPVGQLMAGGHALLVIAYNASGHFLVLSSWGPRWGIDGYCWMSAAYIKWALSRDFWVIDRPPMYYPTKISDR